MEIWVTFRAKMSAFSAADFTSGSLALLLLQSSKACCHVLLPGKLNAQAHCPSDYVVSGTCAVN